MGLDVVALLFVAIVSKIEIKEIKIEINKRTHRVLVGVGGVGALVLAIFISEALQPLVLRVGDWFANRGDGLVVVEEEESGSVGDGEMPIRNFKPPVDIASEGAKQVTLNTVSSDKITGVPLRDFGNMEIGQIQGLVDVSDPRQGIVVNVVGFWWGIGSTTVRFEENELFIYVAQESDELEVFTPVAGDSVSARPEVHD